MKLSFTKMHGIGNDYIYFNCLEQELADPSGVAIAMSPRHFSVGADGIVMIGRSAVADAKMRMFNADGSEGKMCGNAIRCVGKYLYDRGLTDKTALTIETLSGIKTLSLLVENGKVKEVCVDMGQAVLTCPSIPVLLDKPQAIREPIRGLDRDYTFTAVSMGNPHAVLFLDAIDTLALETIGPHFENHPLFPERVNTEFVRLLPDGTLSMRVWERGSGETYACGTGACAAAVAAVVNGYCRPDTDITVHLIGGALKIRVGTDLSVQMTGPCTKVYEGEYDYEIQDQ